MSLGLAVLLVAPADLAAGGGAAAASEVWLVDVTAASGVDARQHSGAKGEFRLPEIMGGGVALFDHDGDGDLDVYLVDADGPNRLFSQVAPWRFRDVTAASGLGDRGSGMGVAVGDVDNDGDLDVYLTNVGADRLYLNRGQGRFEDATAAAGIEVDGWSTSATFLDYDGDGRLDLWVARYVRGDPSKHCTDAAGRRDYCSPAVFPPEGDVLLHNEGGGHFADVSAAAGVRAAVGRGLGVVSADFEGDGRIDVYVANDGDANHLWVNQGSGRFRERALLLGAALNLDGEAEAGMGVLAADLDGDLTLDLFMTHLSEETNTFYRNRGSGHGFEDATARGGLAQGSLAATGFGTVAVDLELDGDLDLVVVNGRVTLGPADPAAKSGEPWRRFAETNAVWLNDGAGRFAEAGREVAPFSAPAEISRGLAAGDIDGDGDDDLVVANIEGPLRLYRNDAPRRGAWLAVRAVDPALGREAIGAEVRVTAGGRTRLRLIGRGSSYLSSGDAEARFGLGRVGAVDAVDVVWPGGAVERFAAAGVDRRITVERGAGTQPK